MLRLISSRVGKSLRSICLTAKDFLHEGRLIPPVFLLDKITSNLNILRVYPPHHTSYHLISRPSEVTRSSNRNISNHHTSSRQFLQVNFPDSPITKHT